METKKIAMACFIGGFVCAAIAVAVNPMFWWLGMIAGFASGYLAYEFREVLQAIPKAWQSAQGGSGDAWKRTKKLFRECFLKPHPFWHPAILIFLLIFSFFYCQFPKIDLISCFSATLLCVFLFVFIVDAIILFGEDDIGYVVLLFSERFSERCRSRKTEAVWQPLTYGDFLRWTSKGIFRIGLFFVWYMWKYTVIGIWRALCFLCRFAKTSFILIHSNKRLLCAIDGTIGGTIAYVYLASPSMSIHEKALLCLFGGAIGAVIGVANYEVVYKVFLRLPVNNS